MLILNTEKSRWKDVGYCDTPNVRCWIDSESVKDVLEFSNLEDKALGEITKSDLDALGLMVIILLQHKNWIRNLTRLCQSLQIQLRT